MSSSDMDIIEEEDMFILPVSLESLTKLVLLESRRHSLARSVKSLDKPLLALLMNYKVFARRDNRIRCPYFLC